MFAKWIDPVVKDYLFYDSPLRKPAAQRTLFTIVAVLVVLSFFGVRSVMEGASITVVWVWLPITILGSILGYLILSFLDRERRIGFFHFLTVLSVVFVLNMTGSE